MKENLYIVIPTHNRRDLLERTLNSLTNCKFPSSYASTIVVENGGKFGTEELIESFDKSFNIQYIYSEPANKSIAMNIALADIDNSYIFFADDDIRFAPNILIEYEKAIDNFPNNSFFGGAIDIDYPDGQPADWMNNYLPHSFKGFIPEIPMGICNFYFVALNWLAKSQDIKKVGGFDEKYGLKDGLIGTGDETEIQKRLRNSGLKAVYVPMAKVWHYIPEDRLKNENILKKINLSGKFYGFNLGNSQIPIKYSLIKYLEKVLPLFTVICRICLNKKLQFKFDYYYSYISGICDGIRLNKKYNTNRYN